MNIEPSPDTRNPRKHDTVPKARRRRQQTTIFYMLIEDCKLWTLEVIVLHGPVNFAFAIAFIRRSHGLQLIAIWPSVNR